MTSRPWLVALIAAAGVGLAANGADAKPKRRDARVAFDRGVAAYKKGNYAGASDALGKSFELERDLDTLFAWAQSERKLNHCEKAIELYEKLLASNLPDANKKAVEATVAECRALLAPPLTPEPAPPATPPVAEPEPTPPATPTPATPDPREPAPPIAATSDREPTRVDAPAGSRGWYKDPVALSLLGTGVVGTGVGVGLLVSANSLSHQTAATYPETKVLSDRAKSRGTLGLVVTGAGSALPLGGIVWAVTHGSSEQPAVSAWLAPGSGGVVYTRGF